MLMALFAKFGRLSDTLLCIMTKQGNVYKHSLFAYERGWDFIEKNFKKIEKKY